MSKSILAAILPLAAVYLLGSFVAVSFDITQWDIMGRFMVAILGVATSVFCWAMHKGYA